MVMTTTTRLKQQHCNCYCYCYLWMYVGLMYLSWGLMWSSLLACAKVITDHHLPGFHGSLPFSLETGYVDVDSKHGVQLFYYFIESEGNPEVDPLMLWLTGGPGCSALSGLIYEIGPLTFDVNKYTDGLPNLIYKSDSWTKVSNIIFLDSPVGTGFSYSNTEEGYHSSDTKAAHQIVIFITKWLDEHPNFKSNPLYIAGDSYSGLIVPIVTLELASASRSTSTEPLLNLKGYLVGNPLTDHKFDDWAVVPFAHGMGLISDELYEMAKKSCRGDLSSPTKTAQCVNSLGAISECIKGINTNQILEPVCPFASPRRYKVSASRRKMLTNNEDVPLLKSTLPSECRTMGYILSGIWANDATVREALGIHKGTVPSWLRCNYDISYTEDLLSGVPYHLNVTNLGYRALVYSGDHDMVIPSIGTQAWIRSLNFSIVDDWRPWLVSGQVAGFTRTYSNNLTFATVKGAGHTAPEYKPKECMAMFKRWLSGNPL